MKLLAELIAEIIYDTTNFIKMVKRKIVFKKRMRWDVENQQPQAQHPSWGGKTNLRDKPKK